MSFFPEDVDAEVAAHARDAGLEVYSGTVNEPEQAREFASFGLRGIVTDDPLAVRGALGVAEGEAARP